MIAFNSWEGGANSIHKFTILSNYKGHIKKLTIFVKNINLEMNCLVMFIAIKQFCL